MYGVAFSLSLSVVTSRFAIDALMSAALVGAKHPFFDGIQRLFLAITWRAK